MGAIARLEREHCNPLVAQCLPLGDRTSPITRLQDLGRQLDRFQSIRGVGNLKLRPLLQHRTNKSAEALKVIDHKYAKGPHYPLSPIYSNLLGVILGERLCLLEASAIQLPE